MLPYIVGFLGAAVVFSCLDAIWLTLTGSSLYRPVLGSIMLPNFRLGPAIAFYVVYLIGVVFFAVQPGLEKGSVLTATLRGAALGFVAYATYDLTNQATLVVWSVKITILDLCWGTFVTAMGATAGYFAAHWAAR